MIIYKDEWTQRLVMKARNDSKHLLPKSCSVKNHTYNRGMSLFRCFFVVFSQGPVLWQKKAEPLWDFVRYDVDVKLQQSQDSHKFRLNVCGVCLYSPSTRSVLGLAMSWHWWTPWLSVFTSCQYGPMGPKGVFALWLGQSEGSEP